MKSGRVRAPHVSRRIGILGVLAATGAFAATVGAEMLTVLPTGADQIWTGDTFGAQAGTSLAVGAVGGDDAEPDLIVGAPGNPPPLCLETCLYTRTVGRVHVIFGGTARTGTLPVSSADAVVAGTIAGEAFGADVAVGNVLNSKGSFPQNLVVGAPPGPDPSATNRRGAVYLFAGGFSNGDSLTTAKAVLTVLGHPDEEIGTAVATADLNNDGYADLLIGAPVTGRIYVINGSASLGGTIDLATASVDIVLSGSGIGTTMAVGDVSGDGVDDVLIGAPTSTVYPAGAVYIVYGVSSGSLDATLDLPARANALFVGIDSGDRAGWRVGVADVDGDGHADMLITAQWAFGPDDTRPYSGEVYLIWGTGSIVQSAGLSEAPVTLFGEGGSIYLGGWLSAGDINGDGLADLVMGMPTRFTAAVYYGRQRDAIGVLQPDGRRFVDFRIPGQADRRIHGDGTQGFAADFRAAKPFGGVAGYPHHLVITSPQAARPGVPYAGYVYFIPFERLTPNTQQVRMVAMQGESAAGYFEILSASPTPVDWLATDEQPWLTYTPAAGEALHTNAAEVYITGSTRNLSPSRYAATIVVSEPADAAHAVPVTVTFDVLSRPVITASTSFPAAAGAPITFTAAVTGGAGSFEYRFWRFASASGWTLVRDYAPSPSWTWTPTATDTAEYLIQVWVRAAGSSADWEAWGSSSSFTIATVPVVTLSSDVAFPAATGTQVTWTVQTTGGIAPLEFKFWRFKAGAGWTIARDWAPSNIHTWTPGPADAGSYQYQAWVRNAGSPGNPDAAGLMEFTITNGTPIAGQSLTVDRMFPVDTGTSMTWTAQASGGTQGPLQYQFWRYRQETASRTVVQEYSNSNRWTWTPGYSDSGTYRLEVRVRSAGSTSSFETFMTSDTWIVTRARVTITAITTDKVSPQAVNTSGSTIKWTTHAIGGSGPLEYTFWLYDIGRGLWRRCSREQFDEPNEMTTSFLSRGTYVMQVWVRTVGAPVEYEAWANSELFHIQ